MSCPYSGSASLTILETPDEFQARFEGDLSSQAVAPFSALARRVRAAPQPKTVRLDISPEASIYDTGLAGILTLEAAARETGAILEIRASGPHAAETLARIGLARLLYSGP